MPAPQQSPIVLALLPFAFGLFAFDPPAQAQQFDVARGRAAIVNATNAYREKEGLPPLRQHAGANRVAQAYATYLALTDKAGHRADGRRPSQRLSESGVGFCKFRGENWHRSWTWPKQASLSVAMSKAMAFWKRSPGHERTLRSASTHIGVGLAGWKHDDRWIYTAVQLFIVPCPAESRAVPAVARSGSKSVQSIPNRNPQRRP